MDPEFKALICDCWDPEPALRPSFPVILIRLKGIGAPGNSKNLNLSDTTVEGEIKIQEDVKNTCRSLNDLLWNYTPERWDSEHAAAVVDKDATVTALDPTLRQILQSGVGPKCARSLGWMMFGGLEDGAEIHPEPVLDTDIVVMGLDESYALLKTRFAVVAPKKIKQWRVNDTREFDGLQAALQASENSIKSWGVGGLEAATSGEDSSESKKKRKRRRRRKKPKKSKKDVRVEHFIKATRFVRGYGAAAIHPSAKIELHGLRMQALKGDYPKEGAAGDSTSSAGALQRLKLEAWRSFQGKSQEEAMEEYLSLLTSLAPNWKVAHIVMGRQTDEERRKPKEMMWILKVGYRTRSKEEWLKMTTNSRPTTMAGARKLKDIVVTSIEVLQSSNACNAKLWSEEADALDKATEMDEARKGKGVAGETPLSETASFLAGLPKDFTLSDCIIDKDEHATM